MICPHPLANIRQLKTAAFTLLQVISCRHSITHFGILKERSLRSKSSQKEGGWAGLLGATQLSIAGINPMQTFDS